MIEPTTGRRIRALVTPGRRRDPGAATVWLPWLAAPIFAAAPIGGCAVADRMRPPVACAAAHQTVAEPSAAAVVPTGAVVTVGRP